MPAWPLPLPLPRRSTALTGLSAVSAMLSLLVPWSLLVGAAACIAAAPVPVPVAAEPLPVLEVRPGVFVHTGRLEDWGPSNGGDVANLGFIVGARCVAVIDTGGTPALGERLRAAVARATRLPVCYVINTHAHPDHLLGSVAFSAASATSAAALSSASVAATASTVISASAPPAVFVASAGFRRTLAAREPHYLNAYQRDFGLPLPRSAIVYPTTEVAGSLDLDLGDRVLTLRAWPTAHTDNDLTVLDRRTRTLFASDLLFVQHVPVLDGSLRGWLAVMDEMRRLDVATVVPGHGAVSHDWPAVMNAQTDYLASLLRDTRAAIRAMLPIQQAVARIAPPPGSAWLLTERFHRRNLTAAYAELEWEDDADAGVPAATRTPVPVPAPASASASTSTSTSTSASAPASASAASTPSTSRPAPDAAPTPAPATPPRPTARPSSGPVPPARSGGG